MEDKFYFDVSYITWDANGFLQAEIFVYQEWEDDR